MSNTGPPYPHPYPVPGSNFIGGFKIALDPVGDIPPFDPWQTIISQYANSPILDALITDFNAAIDITQFFDEFYDDEFNVDTAVGYGLDVWGRIVGVPRTLKLSGTLGNYFGFEEGSGWLSFGSVGGTVGGIFYSGASAITSNITLNDAQYRQVIIAKALANVSDGSIQSLNTILLELFGFSITNTNQPYVQDNQNMSITLVFLLPLSAVQLAIIQSGILPIPNGVQVFISQP
jgi:hypothetical protein